MSYLEYYTHTVNEQLHASAEAERLASNTARLLLRQALPDELSLHVTPLSPHKEVWPTAYAFEPPRGTEPSFIATRNIDHNYTVVGSLPFPEGIRGVGLVEATYNLVASSRACAKNLQIQSLRSAYQRGPGVNEYRDSIILKERTAEYALRALSSSLRAVMEGEGFRGRLSFSFVNVPHGTILPKGCCE